MRKLSKEVQQEIKMYQANDYEIGEETTAYIEMTKKNPQSVGMHILLLFFTAGIGNVVYAIYKIMTPKKKKVMK